MKKKHAWLAAVLNFLVPGAGYLYVGSRVRFGVLLIAGMALMTFGPQPEYVSDIEIDYSVAAQDPGFIVLSIAAVMVAGGFAYDAYLDAKQHNSNIKSKSSAKKSGKPKA